VWERFFPGAGVFVTGATFAGTKSAQLPGAPGPHTMSSANPPLVRHLAEVSEVAAPDFHDTYHEHFDFVWLSLRRLGVAPELLDDATQDVFVVVCRKLPEFQHRSQLKTWLFAIAIRVARGYRRRRPTHSLAHPEEVPSPDASPYDSVEEAEAQRLVSQFLSNLDEERRIVFIMAEIEQIPLPEIAQVLGWNLNTTYSRLRLGRADFNAQVQRHAAREQRGTSHGGGRGG
jgi:RNA polymerase sigma-70 factor (ECF subfamily)